MVKLPYLIICILLLFSCTPSQDKVEVTVRDTIYEHVTVFDTIMVPQRQEIKERDSVMSEQDSLNRLYYVMARLPKWIVKMGLLEYKLLSKAHVFDHRMNPMYLEADFNNDGHEDVAVPIIEKETGKCGFAIIHGKTREVFYVGAGTMVKKSWSDDWCYADIWSINRERINEPGVGENEPLILEHEALRLEVSDLGGGIIFWNGVEYEYFHQTC